MQHYNFYILAQKKVLNLIVVSGIIISYGQEIHRFFKAINIGYLKFPNRQRNVNRFRGCMCMCMCMHGRIGKGCQSTRNFCCFLPDGAWKLRKSPSKLLKLLNFSQCNNGGLLFLQSSITTLRGIGSFINK